MTASVSTDGPADTAGTDTLRALSDAATPGKWDAVEGAWGLPSDGPDHMRVVQADYRNASEAIARLEYDAHGGADAAFIAAAVNHVRAVLAALEQGGHNSVITPAGTDALRDLMAAIEAVGDDRRYWPRDMRLDGTHHRVEAALDSALAVLAGSTPAGDASTGCDYCGQVEGHSPRCGNPAVISNHVHGIEMGDPPGGDAETPGHHHGPRGLAECPTCSPPPGGDDDTETLRADHEWTNGYCWRCGLSRDWAASRAIESKPCSASPDDTETLRAGCKCTACEISPHWSDCDVHSEPAFPKGPCSCGADSHPPRQAEDGKDWREVLNTRGRESLLREVAALSARLDTATAENERLRERVEIQQDAIRGLGEIDAEKSAALDTARADALNEAADAWEESRGDTSATVYQWLRACAATTAPEDTT